MPYCEQCEHWFEAQRSTARYCSARCRVAHKRDRELAMLKGFSAEEVASMTRIKEVSPRAVGLVQRMRKLHGLQAAHLAIEIAEALMRQEQQASV